MKQRTRNIYSYIQRGLGAINLKLEIPPTWLCSGSRWSCPRWPLLHSLLHSCSWPPRPGTGWRRAPSPLAQTHWTGLEVELMELQCGQEASAAESQSVWPRAHGPLSTDNNTHVQPELEQPESDVSGFYCLCLYCTWFWSSFSRLLRSFASSLCRFSSSSHRLLSSSLLPPLNTSAIGVTS